MTIPLEEGFTVVTGPNGSGKSNILDGVLFCLGLANSKGMRADRLPDLVNSGVLRAGKAAETIVSVRFDLTGWVPDSAEAGLDPSDDGPWIKADQNEWVVTRRLRVMPGGSYSSTYSSDGEVCNLQQLQTQLRRLRIDPEGSNVVMQGDVTRIVSMSNRDRRGLIDELAGVALFDNRIAQTRAKLEAVHERQERCRIVEQELLTSRQRLEKDCAKARTYKELKEKLQLAKQQELILAFEAAQKSWNDLKFRHHQLGEKEVVDSAFIQKVEKALHQSVEKLKTLQSNVKDLGEDQLIAVQAELAGLDTQSRELDRQASLHQQDGEKLQQRRQDLIDRRLELQSQSDNKEGDVQAKLLEIAEQTCKDAEAAVDISRRRLGDVAGRSGAWLEDHKHRIVLRQKLQHTLTPLQNEQQTLEECLRQDESMQQELERSKQRDSTDNQNINQKLVRLDDEVKSLLSDIKTRKKAIHEVIQKLEIEQRTRVRLETEQSRLERDIARLESRRETIMETRGTGALRVLLEAGLEGIHGHVAQLGEVEDCHRVALEVAAGSRLAQVVVDDDRIAAKAIDLLKNRRAGRLTFLPLNKIRSAGYAANKALSRGNSLGLKSYSDGFIGRAIDLVNFDPIYTDVFSYVFGDTLVFSNLNAARTYLGVVRSVTVDGELLEKSGAMTGGSLSGRHFSIGFGRSNEADEVEPLRKRLLELGETLLKCSNEETVHNQFLDKASPHLRDLEQRYVAIEAEMRAAKEANQPFLERAKEFSDRLKDIVNRREIQQKRLEEISEQINPLLLELEELDKKEQFTESDGNTQNWQRLKEELEIADKNLLEARTNRDLLLNKQRQRQLVLERLEDQQNALKIEEIRLQDEVKSLTSAHSDWREANQRLKTLRKDLEEKQNILQTRFGEQRRARDEAEADVANQRQKLQELQWNLVRLREDRQAMAEELRLGQVKLDELEKTIPDPVPFISDELRQAGLESLQLELKQLQQRMEDLEPVNMLALEELEKLNTRLNDLGERLDVLSEERSELLLRIETVATLRQEAFMEAFESVDTHFSEIFANLSDGDGHLQLDNKEDPLEGGLTLVAHPKGKAVRRLAAMSGGEKSLTALSFLFALQRFRPSPFYALDEVDSFLDGVNVERLSSLIASQAEHAQFLVVSHRRPMIGASTRTIGVTQARGSHTQVVGLPNAA